MVCDLRVACCVLRVCVGWWKSLISRDSVVATAWRRYRLFFVSLS